MRTLAHRATINPFFTILYSGSKPDYSVKVESVFKNIVEKNAMPMERLKRLSQDQNHVNIQNFLNEAVALAPLIGRGRFIDEGNDKTPDFVASICGSDVALECVSVNEDAQSTKDKNRFLQNSNAEFKRWKQQNESGVFRDSYIYQPFGTNQIDKIATKIKDKKSSAQVRPYRYKVMIMSFYSIWWLHSCNCLLLLTTLYEGCQSNFIYYAFYGRKGDLVFEGNSFEGDGHKITILPEDGKFQREDCIYNMAILHFETESSPASKEFVFYENPKNPMRIDILYELMGLFNPYATHSILFKVVTKDVVEARAYRRWEDAGREHGNDWAHWFKAKEDLGLPHDQYI